MFAVKNAASTSQQEEHTFVSNNPHPQNGAPVNFRQLTQWQRKAFEGSPVRVYLTFPQRQEPVRVAWSVDSDIFMDLGYEGVLAVEDAEGCVLLKSVRISWSL